MFGRLIRVGQEEEPHIYVISQGHCFNRSEEYNAAKKMLEQLAGDYPNIFQKINEDTIMPDAAADQQPDDQNGKSTVAREAAITEQIRTVAKQADQMVNAITG